MLNFSLDFKREQTLQREIMICGYPNPIPSNENHKQYYEKAKSNSATVWQKGNGFLNYYFTTEHGNSGCPVFIKTSPNNF